ncbi:MAG: CoA-binding protein [Candidatus Aenigmatarchaeota archaeon]|nr:MAG: CoA-binding protein [Candidatus Aenigmarchaeota archaeon]
MKPNTKNLEYFFNPKSIAVVGASRSEGKIGNTIFGVLVKNFRGKVYPVNPKADRILGRRCYPSVLDTPDVDLVVVAVPAVAVPKVMEEVVEKGTKAAVIITSGFGEIGNHALEERVKRIITGKVRVIGPNCLGVYDSSSKVDTMFLPEERLKRPVEGPVAFISQSGAFGSVMMDAIGEEGIGVSKFMSIGNKIDVDEIDLMKYLEEDEKTGSIAIYLEGTEDGKKLMKVGKEVSKKKPVVCLKAGKSKKGTEAVSSHTGSMAGSARVYSAAFRQSGIIEAKTTEELFDFAKALAYQEPTGGRRIMIVTDGGGFGIVATDQAEKEGFDLVELDKKSKEILRKCVPEYAIIKNPIDLTGDADSERYRKTLDLLCRNERIDGIVCIVLLQITTLGEDIVPILVKISRKYRKPMTFCATGGKYTLEKTRELEKEGLPVYPTPERAVKAMSALVKRGEWLRKVL